MVANIYEKNLNDLLIEVGINNSYPCIKLEILSPISKHFLKISSKLLSNKNDNAC